MRKSIVLGALIATVITANAFAVGEVRQSGVITDAATKQPIPDATITVVATDAITFKQTYPAKKDGTYAIFLIRGDVKYEFTYSAPGHQSYKETAKLKVADPNTRDVSLVPLGVPGAAPARVAEPAKADPAIVAYNEGADLANDGKDAEAIAKFEQAVAAKPELTAAWKGLATLYHRTKAYPKAIEAANKALAQEPEATDMNAILYESYTATGDKAKAAEFHKKVPVNAAGLFNEAAKLINAGKDAEAEALLKQAVGADDKFAPAYYELGMLDVRLQKNAEAKTNLEKYLELDPKGKDAATAKEMLNYVK